MPLRSDPSLWYNLAGVVAAYQPVRAPNALNARYNVAHGGDNRYRAEPGVLPTWSGAAGWIGNSSGWLVGPQLTPSTGTWIIRFSGLTSNTVLFGYNGTALRAVREYGTDLYVGNGGATSLPTFSVGVLGMAGNDVYKNGIYQKSASGVDTTPRATGLLSYQDGGRPTNATLIAFTAYGRVLSASEMWYASRQMAYCDVNPEWSVWSPRRKWFPYIAATTAGRPGIYGARPTVALPGGVRIVPQDEGGING